MCELQNEDIVWEMIGDVLHGGLLVEGIRHLGTGGEGGLGVRDWKARATMFTLPLNVAAASAEVGRIRESQELGTKWRHWVGWGLLRSWHPVPLAFRLLSRLVLVAVSTTPGR